MKHKFDDEELKLLESIEKGEWRTIENSEEELKKHQSYARKHLNKDKRINIRISSRDLELLKLRSMKEGLPYQTFISSILHKYINNYQ
jgi:predicted DNA binding CopG/RHH family protein